MDREVGKLLWIAGTLGILGIVMIPAYYLILSRGAATDTVDNMSLQCKMFHECNGVVPTSAAYFSSGPGASNVLILPGALTPRIASFAWNIASGTPVLTIEGQGFGNPPSPSANLPVLSLTDETAKFTIRSLSGFSSSGPSLTIESWTDHRIVVGFAHYGADTAQGVPTFLTSGDAIQVTVTNPQTGNTGNGSTTVPDGLVSPSLTLSPSEGTIATGMQETVTGSLAFQGQPLTDVPITLTASAGTWETTTVDTGANGQWSATYTAPSAGGTVTLTATADGQSASQNIVVEQAPEITGVSIGTSGWPPTLTLAGSAFGTGGTGEDVTISDQTGNWTAGPSWATTSLKVANWSDSGITVDFGSGYGGKTVLLPGDHFEVTVTNPQNGLSVAYNGVVPSSLPLPSVSLSAGSPLSGDQSEGIGGSVSYDGTALANQTVTLSATAGSVSESSVTTNSSGDWSASYTAPDNATTAQITASSDGGSAISDVVSQGAPGISGVSIGTSGYPPSFTITGSGFGQAASNEYVQLVDNTQGWQAGSREGTSAMIMNVSSWTPNQIVVPTTGAYGANPAWVMLPGNSMTMNVYNPQTGAEASYNFTAPSNLPLPYVVWKTPGSVQAGASETLCGTLEYAGVPQGGQTVYAKVSAGTLSSSSAATNNSSTGHGTFQFTFTAPDTGGNVTLCGEGDGGAEASATIPVTEPAPSISSVTFEAGPGDSPEVVINGSGFGESASGEYVQISDNSQGWQGGTKNSAVLFTVPTWNPNQIIISNMSNYEGPSNSPGDYMILPGDALQVNVTNPQSGKTASFDLTAPNNLPTPLDQVLSNNSVMELGYQIVSINYTGDTIPNPNYAPFTAACVTGAGTYPGAMSSVEPGDSVLVTFCPFRNTRVTKITGTICSNLANASARISYEYPSPQYGGCYGFLGSCTLPTGPSQKSFSYTVPSDAENVQLCLAADQTVDRAKDLYGAFRAIAYLSTASSSS